MTDNELISHFKLQSPAFDEMPGDALWAKIESGLDSAKPSPRPNTLLFIIAGTLLTALAICYFSIYKPKAETILPVEPITVISTTQPESIITNEPSGMTTINSSANAAARTVTEPAIITEDLVEPVVAIQDSVKKARIRTAKIRSVTAADQNTTTTPYVKFRSYTKGTVAPMDESLTFEVIKKETSENIIIITKQKITDAEYRQLIVDMLSEYESKPGALLTIKAPGHIPFKKVMGLDHKLTVGLKLDDSIFNPKKLKPTSATLQTESPKLNITTLNPSVISFKSVITKDSLPATNSKLSE